MIHLDYILIWTIHISNAHNPIWLVDTILESAGLWNWLGLSNAFKHVMGQMAKGLHFPIMISEELT